MTRSSLLCRNAGFAFVLLTSALLWALPSFAASTVPDSHTVLLEHFDSESTPGMPGYGNAADLTLSTYRKFLVPGWYVWPFAYDPTGKEGTVELFVKPRAPDAGFLTLNWFDATTSPP